MISKLLRRISEQGLYDTALFAFDLAINQVRARLMLRRWKIKSAYIGSRSIIRGADRIYIGVSFYSMDMLWLDVIKRYAKVTYESARISIGDNVSISRNVHIASINEISIGDNCLIGSNVIISDHYHGDVGGCDSIPKETPYVKRRLHSKGKISIESNVWICDSVVILPGVNIGKNSIIAANSVVNVDIPENCIAAGSPAVVVRLIT